MRLKSRSFTLAELLIATAVFSVLMLALYSAFSSGFFGYRSIQETIDSYTAARHIMDTLDKDLRNCFVYSPAETKFSGQINNLSFLSLTDTYRADIIRQDYAFINYAFESNRLKRLCRLNQDALNMNSSVLAEEMDADIVDFSFSYLYKDSDQVKEKDYWDDPQSLPLAVKVKLAIQNKGRYEFERTIFLHK